MFANVPAKYDGHVASVTKSELVCRLAYACQGGITLQKSDVDMNYHTDDFDDNTESRTNFSFLFIYH